jgi:hypothetical protein
VKINQKEKKKMRNLIFFVVGIITIGIIGCVSQTRNETETKAINSAQSWLELVDSEKYKDSWEKTTEYFKSVVSEKKFEIDTRAVRSPLGKVITRKLMSVNLKTSLPGAPTGKYEIIKYKTSFKNKKSGIETVVLKEAKDNVWKIDGYFIR